jgi:two-component sensor histidine kinase
MQVVQTLISQLGAKLEILRNGGTRFVLSWKVPEAQPAFQTHLLRQTDIV